MSKKNSIFSKPQSGYVRNPSNVVAKSVFSKNQKQMNNYQNVENIDDLQIDQISQIISNNKAPIEQYQDEGANGQQELAADEMLYNDEGQDEELDYVQDLNDDKMTSVSQLKPTQSQVSAMSGRTYISSLQRQLNEERSARKNLEADLNELKKLSSEISSQLSQIQKAEQNKAVQV